MTRNPGRGGHRWRQARQYVLDTQDICAWCGKPVDKTLSGKTRWGPTVDHRVPLSQGGPELDRSNLLLMHLRCNSQKKDGTNRRKRRPDADTTAEW